VFDSQDTRFGEFRIWKDGNSDGVVDDGEMMTLQEAGFAANEFEFKRRIRA
jgi:serine-aspartate repeat-containing protein C/D/E